MKIALTGSIAYDYLMSFPGHFKEHFLEDKLDSISLSFLVDKMVKRRGGIGPNIGYTMALLGGNPLLFSTVGEDFETKNVEEARALIFCFVLADFETLRPEKVDHNAILIAYSKSRPGGFAVAEP